MLRELVAKLEMRYALEIKHSVFLEMTASRLEMLLPRKSVIILTKICSAEIPRSISRPKVISSSQSEQLTLFQRKRTQLRCYLYSSKEQGRLS